MNSAKDYPFIFDMEAGLTTIRDPMILVDGGTYYLTGTQPPYWKGENDGVRLWSSKDLKKWVSHGLVVRRADLPEDGWARDRFWAPELFRTRGGKYLLTFNAKNESAAHPHPLGVGIAVADCVTGPYTVVTVAAPVSVTCGESNDATLFQADDGRVLIGFTSEHRPGDPSGGCNKLQLSELDVHSFSLKNSRTVCYCGPDGAWDSVGVEGQCLLRRGGRYIMWYSSWTRGYEAGILTADTPDGPWVRHPDNPILSDNAYWRRAGHNHCFRGPDGRDYLIFHASVPEGAPDLQDGFSERLFIRPVEYLADGKPVIHGAEWPLDMRL